ncbi:hypothetical protein [Wukongibacter sp. M2B1]|uniref:hypothetical protein n=1 Tax=Wukongibacter sp. M2B1 TaxID=3088895 RepID=UPI003D796269
MLQAFRNSFYNLIDSRVVEISNKIVIGNENYKDLNQQLIDLHTEIEKHLPEEYKYLIFRYEEAATIQIDIIEKIIYKQGFKDGFKIRKLINNI